MISSTAKRSWMIALLLVMAVPKPTFAVDASMIIAPEDARRASSQTARDIVWETSLIAAKAQASKLNKPIFWVHMLGNVDGYT
ncbi:MAG: hypothetical protein K2Z81_27435 [Cyanobacteria bacterium]|nr:hypothetical protein [Cyanobacteriota bacterium]